MIIVIGHKNPDTDSVISALGITWFLNKQNKKAKAVIAGEINKETKFVLSFFNQETPLIVDSKDIENNPIFLVDHNDLQQSLAKPENIIGILDHHLISGIKTNKPIFFRVEPLGSTSTLVYKLFKEANFEIKQKEACLLLSGIISDTLNLNSPTTTKEDIDAVDFLVKISNIKVDELANEMFKAKSDFSDKNIIEVIKGDLKEYNFNEKKIAIGVAETTSFEYFQTNEKELLNSIKELKDKENYHHFFFAVVDIINKNTRLYPAELAEREIIKKLFKSEEKDNYLFLKNIVSRKKEIAPPLSNYYNQL